MFISCTMESGEEGCGSTQGECEGVLLNRFYNPFPPMSTTLLVGPSYIGKSYLLKQLLEHQHLFFENVVERVLVINCRAKIEFYELQAKENSPRPLPKVEQMLWSDFDLDMLEAGDVVIVDDLQTMSDVLRELITAAVHHHHLAHLFIVTHKILRTPKYELLSYAHRILLFMKGSAGITISGYIVSNLVKDEEMRDYLGKVQAAAQRQQTCLLLQLNSLPGHYEPHHIAVTHLEERFNPNLSFSVVYSHPASARFYLEAAAEKQVNRLTAVAATSLDTMPKGSDLIPGSFVILSPENVEQLRYATAENANKGEGVEDESAKCLEENKKLWNRTVFNLERDIENFIPNKKWMKAKNLLREILRNPDICILDDQRRMRLKSIAGATVSLLDFIVAASRRDGPTEKRSKGNSKEYKMYKLFVQSLLNNHAPQMLFANKLVLPSLRGLGQEEESRKKKRSSKSYSRHHKCCTRRHKRKRKDSSSHSPSPTHTEEPLQLTFADL